MSIQYASALPAEASNHIRNVAIVGATGTIGSEITAALLKAGKHKVTAITREGSTADMPAGVHVARVDYDEHTTLVKAMKGQDILLISMNTTAPRDSQTKLINAAKDAGVSWIMPNEWGYGAHDPDDQFAKDILIGVGIAKTRQYIKEMGLNFIGLTNGFWYEFSLGGSEARYGFDFPKRSLTLFDDVAKLLALPIYPENASDKSLTMSKYKNDSCQIGSFHINQKDMFASVLRVTDTTEEDWTITHEESHERFKRGCDMMEKGDMTGFGIRLYTRAFWPDNKGDFWSQIQNKELGLEPPSLDVWTKKGVDIGMSGGTRY